MMEAYQSPSLVTDSERDPENFHILADNFSSMWVETREGSLALHSTMDWLFSPLTVVNTEARSLNGFSSILTGPIEAYSFVVNVIVSSNK